VLRITETINSDAIVLKLEGKLLEPWTQETRDAIAAAQQQNLPVQLDLCDIHFADRAGAQLLHDLLADGVTLARCSGFISELLERSRTS
jgi:ABC-type transporter Mla MlaB component